MKKDLLSIIVPCYNEEEVLPLFSKEIIKVLNEMEIDYELLFVNDGSKDRTIDVIKEFCIKDKHTKYISFSRNFGKEAAMYAGLCSAKGEYVGFIDADLQHPPVYLKQMLEILKNSEYDCVACKRTSRKGDNSIRTLFSRLFYKIVNYISDFQMIDGAGDYRLMKRRMVNAIMSMNEHNRFSKGIFSWVGFKTYWIEYENVERAAGKTSWSFFGLVKYAIDGIINFSNAPLEIATYLGIITTFLSFVYMFYVVIKYLVVGDPVAGWATLICVILFIGGIQLLCIGIIGQYIGKINTETKNRPHYIISESNINE